MHKQLTAITVFISILAVGVVCDHYNMDFAPKIGLLGLTGLAAHLAMSRYLRRRSHRA